MKYPEEVLQDIRSGNDIVDFINAYTTLKAKGSSYFGLCPFHRESTPSFSVSPDKQLYYCFGCGATGNIFNFVMQVENYDFPETIKYLADRIGYNLPELNYLTQEEANVINSKKKALYDIHKMVARFYYENLQKPSNLNAVKYLDDRKLLITTRKKFGIGYSGNSRNEVYLFLKEKGFTDDIILETGLVLKDKNGNFYDRFFGRIMFPIIDIQGRIIAFGGRILDESKYKNSPKYLNSPDTLIFNKSQNLYGINFARLSKTKEYILVEGYMDVITLHQAGFNNAVAVLGTAFNQVHSKVIKKYASSVILLFDNDEAGINAILRAIPILREEDLQIKVLQLRNAKDPDEYIKKFGEKSFQFEIDNSKNYISFQIEQKLKAFNIENSFEKIQFIKEIAKIISTLNTSVEREVFINEAALITNISFKTISDEVEKSVKKFTVNQQNKKYNNSTSTSIKDSDYQLEDAQNSVLKAIINNYDVFDKVSKLLNYSEFLNEPYTKLAKIIYEFNFQKKHIVEADLISYFEDTKYQQKISKIFMLQIDFSDKEKLETSLNHQIKIVKTAYINKKIETLDNISDINFLVEQKKDIQNLYIKL